jgi:ComF family protein
MFMNILREIFFPRRCLGCGMRGISGVLCNPCFATIPLNGSLFCGLCRARLPYGKKICHLDFPYILGAAGNYDDPLLQKLIHALKFKHNREAAAPLGSLLAGYVERILFDPAGSTVFAVPLSKRRERERGFNQSALIADVFAARAGLRIADGGLIRTRHATPQSRAIDIRERRKNVLGAFAVSNNFAVPKNIILVDDVTTSGATLFEAASALKSAGARTIIALTAAKA